ncbi:MAG: thiamine pyrophosphate-dependent enzyme [Chloroflexi bacterium]|nr:thiamine pyrophosphate-dependent enzyme [Chloroflexota bacterium]
MQGTDALRILSSLRGDALVVSTMTTSRLWPFVSSRKEDDLPISNCMGKASSVALGLALSQPARDVWVLDGDGSLAMSLGTLLSIAQAHPTNFVHVVCDDGVYTTVGGSPVPAARLADYAAIARAAGYPAAASFREASALQAALPQLLAGPRPLLVALAIESWDGLGEYGPMTQQVMDDRLIAGANRFWAFRHHLTGGGPDHRPEL